MSKVICQRHNIQFNSVMLHKNKAQLLCEECYIDLVQTNKTFEADIIFLNRASNCPAYLLSKTPFQLQYSKFLGSLQQNNEKELKNQFSQLEQQIRIIQQTLDSVINDLKSQLCESLNMKQEIVQKLKEAMKFSSFQQIVQELRQKNENENHGVSLIEEKFYLYFQILQNGEQEKINKEIVQIIENLAQHQSQASQQYQQKYEQFKKLSLDFNQQHQQFFKSTSIEFQIFPQSRLVQKDFDPIIQQSIESKTQKIIDKSELIYLGSRDGFIKDSIKAKLSGKKNLCMIFKSKNNNQVFGSFSPCLWQKKFTQDESFQSFLFSQNNNLVFPLMKEKANQQQQLLFGQFGQAHFGNSDQKTLISFGPDMSIGADFQQGNSTLGNNFQLDDKYMSQRQTLLFGGAQPNIVEFEIYEITFKQ